MLLTPSALDRYVVFSLGFIAMGKTKGAKDKRPRKRRGGGISATPTTALTPIFASSNNRRGKVTRQQRVFAAHFQDVSSVGLNDGESLDCDSGVVEGVSVGASVGLSVGDSVEDEVRHTQAGGETLVGPTNDESVEQDHIDNDDDEDDSDYCPSEDAGEDSDDEDNKRCDPEIEAWVQEKLNMNDAHNERKVRSILKKSHWMHSATASFASCAPWLTTLPWTLRQLLFMCRATTTIFQCNLYIYINVRL
jgi:hypothetical protein